MRLFLIGSLYMPRFFLPLVLSVLLGGCTSVDTRSPKEKMARQVVFTVNELSDGIKSSYAKGTLANIGDESGSIKIQIIIQDILNLHNLKKIAQWPIKSLGLHAIVAEIGQKRKVGELISELETDFRVETVQAVKSYKLHSYNDPYFQLQNTVNSDGIEHIHSLATGKGVVVGVIDTGIDRRHSELYGRVVYSRNFVDHDQGRFDQDEHGTTVAGIIGSTANNDLGIVGVAPDVQLMAFKACWHDTLTKQASCDSVSLMRALVDVLNEAPDVLNLSLSGPYDPLIEMLLRTVSNQGVVLVGAKDDKKEESFPASLAEVIAVGTSLGNTGGNTQLVLAPGTDILTTTPGSTYAFRSGSSLASAYVSGIAALIRERRPSMSGEEIEMRLRNTATFKIDSVPVVDICAALRRGNEICPNASLARVNGVQD